MSESKFQVGDVVQLKSGGPLMTVHTPAPMMDRLVCVWFAGGSNDSAYFDPRCLVLRDVYATSEVTHGKGGPIVRTRITGVEE